MKFFSRPSLVLALFSSSAFIAVGQAQTVPPPEPNPPGHFADEKITGHIFKPKELAAPNLADLKVPAGFRIQKFAENLGNPRILAISPSGNVYVTRRELGDVLMLKVGPDGLAAGAPMRVASRADCMEFVSSRMSCTLRLPTKFFARRLTATERLVNSK